jgi:hypothetical protein
MKESHPDKFQDEAILKEAEENKKVPCLYHF